MIRSERPGLGSSRASVPGPATRAGSLRPAAWAPGIPKFNLQVERSHSEVRLGLGDRHGPDSRGPLAKLNLNQPDTAA